MAAFSSRDEECITRSIEVNENSQFVLPEPSENSNFVSDCVQWIKAGGFDRVALQFPDEGLAYATDTALAIEEGIQKKVYILADTSYGSCCVDEVAAEHIKSDSIIHFGHTCMSPTRRLPVLFVLSQLPVCVEDSCDLIKRSFCDVDEQIILMSSTAYYWKQSELYEELKKIYNNIICADFNLSKNCEIAGISHKETETDNESIQICSRNVKLLPETKIEEYKILYIGTKGRSFTNIQLSLPQNTIIVFDPVTQQITTGAPETNRFLMKRYYMIERARDAKRVGILVGTLGVSDYLKIINHLMEVAKKVGKKPYLVSVGKINVEKLANFAEIDVFVYVACSENSLVDSKEFYQPILTPYEFEVACNSNRSWSSEYVIEFQDILEDGKSHVPLQTTDSEETVPKMSLVSGTLQNLTINKSLPETNNSTNSLLPRSEKDMAISNVHVGGGGQFLSERSWKGLEQNLGSDGPAVLVKGRKGIAANYEGEGS